MEKEKKLRPFLYGLLFLGLCWLFCTLGFWALNVDNGGDIITIWETTTERIITDGDSGHNDKWEEVTSELKKTVTKVIVFDLNSGQRIERTTTVVKDLVKEKERNHQMSIAVWSRIAGFLLIFIAIICFFIAMGFLVIYLDDASWIKKIAGRNKSWSVYLVSFFIEFLYKKLMFWLV